MIRKLIAAVLVAVLTLAFASCSSPAQTPSDSTPEEKVYKIGFSSISLADSYSKALADAIEKYASQYDNIELSILDGEVDATKQIETTDTFFSQDVDLLMVQAFPGIESSLVKFNESSIPIEFVNIYPTITDEFTLDYYYVGSREAQAGELQAEYLATVLPENAKICYLLSNLGFDSTITRRDGFVKKLAELRSDVTIIDEQTGNADTATAMTVVEDWLQRFGADGIDAIVSQNNALTMGVVEVLKANNLNGKIIVAGTDCLSPYGPDNLLAGDVNVEIFQNPDEQGRMAIETALKILEGKPVEKEVWVNWETVTADNAKDYYNRY